MRQSADCFTILRFEMELTQTLNGQGARCGWRCMALYFQMLSAIWSACQFNLMSAILRILSHWLSLRIANVRFWEKLLFQKN